jgi:deoxyadenosine/deoxycytidine kinase
VSVGPHVAVVGQIGAGKSTLVRALARKLDAMALAEREDEDPYFRGFYEAPDRWAFHHAVFFVEQSVRDQAHAQAAGTAAVQERIVQDHVEVFGAEFHARRYLSDVDWALLQRLGDTSAQLLRPVDLLVFLEIAPDVAWRRLRARGRRDERVIELEYLAAIARRYADLVSHWSASPIMRIDAEGYDFRAERDTIELARLVTQAIGERGRDANPVAGAARRGEGNARA